MTAHEDNHSAREVNAVLRISLGARGEDSASANYSSHCVQAVLVPAFTHNERLYSYAHVARCMLSAMEFRDGQIP